MKNILFILILFAFNVSAQYQSGLIINPNQKKTKQYIPISVNGKEFMSGRNKPYTRYEIQGHYNGIEITEFADALSDYIIAQIPEPEPSGNFFDTNLESDGDHTHDANSHSTTVNDIDEFNFYSTETGGGITIQAGASTTQYVNVADGDGAQMHYDGGALDHIANVRVDATGVTLQSDDGNYFITPLPDADAGASDKFVALDDATQKVFTIPLSNYPSTSQVRTIVGDSVMVQTVDNVSRNAGGEDLVTGVRDAKIEIESGLFDATFTGTSNLTSIEDGGLTRFTRIGRFVTVSGVITAVPTAAAYTAATMNLPTFTGYTGATDTGGMGVTDAGLGGAPDLIAFSENDPTHVNIAFIATSFGTNNFIKYSFTFRLF